MSDSLRTQWREWARSQLVPDDRLEPAVDAALRVAAIGASSRAAAAAARLAGGRGLPDDRELLQAELDRAGVVAEELGGVAPAGWVTAQALTALTGLFRARREALAAELQPAVPAAAVATAASPAATAAPASRPPGPTLREFFGEHSILLLSYVGAFLLIVAAVLYEVYAIGQLSGGLRFAGVLAVDLVFGAAGWACLRSRRMRLVGNAYVAIFALLAPLVAVAAYVFLGLRQRGISVEVAQLLTGSALTVLYGVLCLRLRSHAYGYLALIALPVAWLGGVNAAGAGAWHGPVAALLVAVYAAAAAAARRLPGLGEPFARRAALFVHGAAVVAAAVGLASASPLSWASSATLAVAGSGYVLATLLRLAPGSAHLGLATLGLAWGVAAHQLGLGGWTAPAAVLLVVAYSVVGRTRRPFAAAARDLVHPATFAVALLAAGLWATDLEVHRRTAWWLPVTLAEVAAAYTLHRVLYGQALSLLAAATAASLAVLAGNAALDRGYGEAALELVVLAAGWGLAAEATSHRALRGGLRAGSAVQALVPLLFVTLPAPAAAAALLASAALLAATAWRTRTAAWLLLAGAAFSVDWYWLGRALLPARPVSATTLALLYSPLPVLLGVIGLALRAALGRSWGWPLYAIAGCVALTVLSLSGGDLGLTGRALLAYSAVAYAAAAVEHEVISLALAIVAAGVGLALALSAAGSGPALVLLGLAGLAAAIYAAQLAWRGARRDWGDAHRFLGLAGSGLATLAGFTLTGATLQGAADDLLAELVVLGFAGLLIAESRLHAEPLLDYAAGVAASLATYFAARYLGATNPQWYVAAPGLALVAAGLVLPHDRRLSVDGRVPLAAAGGGAVLLLGTTAAQAFADAGWAYTAWLVAEAVAAVVLGIGTRSRALVVAGAAAVGVGGLRALFVLVEQGLLFAAFGAAAVFLLSLGAALAALRDRVRGPLGTAWREWS